MPTARSRGRHVGQSCNDPDRPRRRRRCKGLVPVNPSARARHPPTSHLELRLKQQIPISFCSTCAFAHSGRTDSQGGPNDHKYGGYHFHHGNGPHDHPGGICPYQKSSYSSEIKEANNQENFFQRHPILSLVGGIFLVGLTWDKYSSRKTKR